MLHLLKSVFRDTRTRWFLPVSLFLHLGLLAGVSASSVNMEPDRGMERIEFTVITELGGGRPGTDKKIGDASPNARAEETEPVVKVRASKAARRKPKLRTPKPDVGSIKKAQQDNAPAETGLLPATPNARTFGSAGADEMATRSGTGIGEEGVDRKTALRVWLREVQRVVNRIVTRNYPKAAVRLRLEGRLKVGVTITEDGTISDIRVLRSSGHQELDRSAQTVLDQLRVPAPPAALAWRKREIALPIRYVL